MWVPKGKRPIVVTTGSHQKVCVFGTDTIDGRQLFRQYDVFNQYISKVPKVIGESLGNYSCS